MKVTIGAACMCMLLACGLSKKEKQFINELRKEGVKLEAQQSISQYGAEHVVQGMLDITTKEAKPIAYIIHIADRYNKQVVKAESDVTIINYTQVNDKGEIIRRIDTTLYKDE